MTRTECNAERGTSTDQVILESIVQRAKGTHEQVEEDPYKEEQSPSTLVDHPQAPFLAPGAGSVRHDLIGRSRIGPLQALEPPALGLVALQVTSIGCENNVAHVRVLLQCRHLAIGKIEARGTFVVGHACCPAMRICCVRIRGETVYVRRRELTRPGLQ